MSCSMLQICQHNFTWAWPRTSTENITFYAIPAGNWSLKTTQSPLKMKCDCECNACILQRLRSNGILLIHHYLFMHWWPWFCLFHLQSLARAKVLIFHTFVHHIICSMVTSPIRIIFDIKNTSTWIWWTNTNIMDTGCLGISYLTL